MADVYPEKLAFTYWDNPILRKKTIDIEEKESQNTREFIEAMLEKLVEHDGLGLAANQVGSDRRICLVAFPRKGDFSEVKALINPRILGESEEVIENDEGCLSFPGLYLKINRPERIEVQAYIPGEGDVRFEAEGILARIICHEVDHLDGIVFIDRISKIRRSLIKRQLREIIENYGSKR